MNRNFKQNEFGRRGFVSGLAGIFFVSKNALLRGLWQLAGSTPPVSVQAALGFVRQFNTCQVALRYNPDLHPAEGVRDYWADRTETFQRILAHKEHMKPGTLGYEWMSRFTPFGDSVFPGWIIDFALVNDRQGYRFILRSQRYCFVTDEKNTIYEAVTPSNMPKAADLASAAAFPGAVPYNTFKDPKLTP